MFTGSWVRTLRDGIWTELPAVSAKPTKVEITSFLRALQRRQLDYLVALATRQRPGSAPLGFAGRAEGHPQQ